MFVKAVEQLDAIPANENPLGVSIAKDLTAMFSEFEGNKYLILVNHATGERVKLWFDIDSPWKKIGDFNKDSYYNWEGEESIPIIQRIPIDYTT